MVEVSLTVGKLDASLALLLTKDHHLIEFPTILLPNGVRAGSIVKIKCEQDLETEKEESQHFQSIQDEILNAFGTNLPQSPVLKIKNITQTSCVLEWDSLELGTASLKNLILFKDGKKLGAIPQPLTNTTTKLSGLPIDKTFQFQLRLDTTAGVYLSETIEVTTHKMTDLSGITVCLGDFSPNDPFTVDDIVDALKNMGANLPPQEQIKVDTTHYICSKENKDNPEFIKASEMNIPIVRPEWLKACESERRIVGVRDFYIKDCVLPDIIGRNYWAKAHGAALRAPALVSAPVEVPAPNEPVIEASETVGGTLETTPSVEETIKSPEVLSSPQDSSMNVESPETKEEPEISSKAPPIPESEVKIEITADHDQSANVPDVDVEQLDEVDLSETPVEEEEIVDEVPIPEVEESEPVAVPVAVEIEPVTGSLVVENEPVAKSIEENEPVSEPITEIEPEEEEETENEVDRTEEDEGVGETTTQPSALKKKKKNKKKNKK